MLGLSTLSARLCSICNFVQYIHLYTYTFVHLYTRALHSCAVLHSWSVFVRAPNPKCQYSEAWGGVYAIFAMGSLCQTFVHLGNYFPVIIVFFSLDIDTFAEF